MSNESFIDVNEGSPSVARSDSSAVLQDLVVLALRVAVGGMFFAQGTTKWGWFGGIDPPGLGGLEQFLEILGYDSPTLLAWLLTATEIGAGLLLIVGLLTPLAAAGVIGIAVNGIFVLSWSTGYANGYSLWIVFIAAALALAFFGPGRFALDSIIVERTADGIRRWFAGPTGVLVALVVGVAVGLIVMNVLGPGFDSTPNFPEFEPSG